MSIYEPVRGGQGQGMTTPLVTKPDPAVRERWVATSLFFATCCTVFLVNWLGWQEAGFAGGWRALGFTIALMTILLTHELGHVAVARLHGFVLGWPWFLPFPWLVGTLGAVIRLRETPRTRTGLLEMGAAGPLAGLAAVVAVGIVWVWGGPVPATDQDGIVLHAPLLLQAMHLAGTGALVLGLTPADPLGFAAWLGCLVTAMNLIPLGQLDGGHVLSALWPARARLVGRIAMVTLLVAGLVWPGWAVWAAMLAVLGARHAVPVRQRDTPPSHRARWVAGATAVAFLLTFTPVPVRWGPIGWW